MISILSEKNRKKVICIKYSSLNVKWVYDFWALQMLIRLFPSDDTHKIHSQLVWSDESSLLDKVNYFVKTEKKRGISWSSLCTIFWGPAAFKFPWVEAKLQMSMMLIGCLEHHGGFWKFSLEPQVKRQMHCCITEMKCCIEKSTLHFSCTKSTCALRLQILDVVLW